MKRVLVNAKLRNPSIEILNSPLYTIQQIGNVVGGIVGEKMGEKTADKFGIGEAAGKMSNDLAKVVGKRNVDKMGEITQTALGYGNEEECVCCPCLPASQTLLFIMFG